MKRALVMLVVINTLVWCDPPGGYAGEDGGRGKTWKTVDELTGEEKAVLDLRTDTPRDPHLPYLPQRRFPRTPPDTAEEMGLRAMEFPHTPFWNWIDMAMTVAHTEFMDQWVTIIPVLYLAQGGRKRVQRSSFAPGSWDGSGFGSRRQYRAEDQPVSRVGGSIAAQEREGRVVCEQWCPTDCPGGRRLGALAERHSSCARLCAILLWVVCRSPAYDRRPLRLVLCGRAFDFVQLLGILPQNLAAHFWGTL